MKALLKPMLAWAAALAVSTAAWEHAAGQHKLAVDGSTGTAPLIDALGKAFTAKSGVVVDIGKGLGTKARLEALSGGKIDIAMASHGLNVSAVRGMGMDVHRIAMTPVVFAVHQSANVASLTDAQICAIYSAGIGSWKDIGGADVGIVPLARPDSEVDAEVVRAGVECFKVLKLPEGVRILQRASDMARALAETRGGIGMTSATVVEQSRGTIKTIALNGIFPSESNVISGHYRLTRDAFVITKAAPSRQVRDFVEFIRTAEGAALIRTNGAIVAAP